jgi:hypothetical protein
MAYDMSKVTTGSNPRTATELFTERDLVKMKSPENPVAGVIVDGEPLVVGGARYWLVAWTFGGEQRVTWSPESAILAA